MSKLKKAQWILITLIGLGLIVYTYLFAFSLKESKSIIGNMIEFNTTYENAEEDGFYLGGENNNEKLLVSSNENLRLYLDETSSHFVVEDIKSGEEIRSNPNIEDPSGTLGDLSNRQKSTILYRYFNPDGRTSSEYNNYVRSIRHSNDSRVPNNNYSTFKLKQIENGFQVFYEIKDYTIDYLDFPKYLEPEVFQPILDNENGEYTALRTNLLLVYRNIIDEETGKYAAQDYEVIRPLYLNRLYDIFYVQEVFGEYSRERVREENAANGYVEDPSKARFTFNVALQVVLEEDGVEIKVINESLTESTRSKLATLTLYPYLGTGINIDQETGLDTEGYLVVPDGSGAAIEFNNNKLNLQSYRRRIYGQDMAILPFEKPENTERILVPVYGMIKENIGYAAIITEGDAMTSINADISGRQGDSYNKIYPTFHVRDTETVVLGTPWESKNVALWTKDIVQTDFTYKIKILTGDNNNYFGVANAYKNYLIDEKDLTPSTENKGKVILELLGTFDLEKHFLGIPYNSMGTLTNYNQALEIVEKLNALDVNNLDIIFTGMTNGGLANNIETKVKFERSVGSKRKFEKFEQELASLGINVYPTANFLSTYEYNRSFDNFKYSSRRLSGDTSEWFEYHDPTRLPYDETPYDYREPAKIISPLYYETIYNKYNKSYQFSNLNVINVGSILASDFDKSNEVYKQEALQHQENMLKNMTQENVIVSEPLGFALPHISMATDLPFESTIYGIFDYQIPLLQLIINDIMPYTINSINLANNRGIDYMFMKVLETGSNLKYTLSYNSSIILLNTYHNYYMSTHYENWLDLIETQNKVMQTHNLDESHIIGHEIIENNVYKTTYSNNVEIILNYTLSTKNIDGISISGMNYYIKGGN